MHGLFVRFGDFVSSFLNFVLLQRNKHTIRLQYPVTVACGTDLQTSLLESVNMPEAQLDRNRCSFAVAVRRQRKLKLPHASPYILRRLYGLRHRGRHVTGRCVIAGAPRSETGTSRDAGSRRSMFVRRHAALEFMRRHDMSDMRATSTYTQ